MAKVSIWEPISACGFIAFKVSFSDREFASLFEQLVDLLAEPRSGLRGGFLILIVITFDLGRFRLSVFRRVWRFGGRRVLGRRQNVGLGRGLEPP